jgi:hypothetical protein
MAVTALELITRSYYLSQVVSRELQTVSGDQITDGLYLLNALLDFKSTDTRLIPYYDRTTFNTIAGTEAYFRPNLLMVDTLTFNIGQVRYSMNEMTREQYFAISRVDNIQSLPFSYRVERVLGGANIYLYFVPADVYVMNLSAKYALSEVTLNQDISLVYDKYYIEYLRHELANMICSDYGATLPDSTMETLKEYRKKLLAVSPPDLSIQGDDYFSHGMGMDWQTVNLTTGWWPF